MKAADFKPGIYEHYKSTETNRCYYVVLGKARHTETEEILVAYIPMYFNKDHKGPKICIRPFEMFIEDVEWEGKTVPRFRYVGQEL